MFHKRKHLIDTDKVDIDRIVLSDQDSYAEKRAFKCFIWNKISKFIKSLCIKLPQMSRYAKYFESNNKYVNFLVHYEGFLKKYNAVWDKISNLLKKDLIVNQYMMKNTLKLKNKLYNGKLIQTFIVMKSRRK